MYKRVWIKSIKKCIINKEVDDNIKEKSILDMVIVICKPVEENNDLEKEVKKI